jgi:hypothetical protein
VTANTVIAVCAVIIAATSLAVSVYEARATRKHNRYSVRPVLELGIWFKPGDISGLFLSNSGLGPAAVTNSSLSFDGVPLGEFNETNVNKVRAVLFVQLAFVIPGQAFLATDYKDFLLSIEPYDPDRHREFYELIRHRLRVEFQYDSIYGGEQFKAVYSPDP